MRWGGGARGEEVVLYSAWRVVIESAADVGHSAAGDEPRALCLVMEKKLEKRKSSDLNR